MTKKVTFISTNISEAVPENISEAGCDANPEIWGNILFKAVWHEGQSDAESDAERIILVLTDYAMYLVMQNGSVWTSFSKLPLDRLQVEHEGIAHLYAREGTYSRWTGKKGDTWVYAFPKLSDPEGNALEELPVFWTASNFKNMDAHYHRPLKRID